MKMQIGDVQQFLGLRTDAPPAKCPSGFSPACSDMVFSVGGMATRNPFRAKLTMPAAIKWRKEFTCKDGSVQELALDVNGVLYSIAQNGTATILDNIARGSSVNSVTAYGREYMAFFKNGVGSDAPRQWDGKNLYRVSQGGPAAPPTVANLSLPPVTLAAAAAPVTTYAVSNISSADRTDVGGGHYVYLSRVVNLAAGIPASFAGTDVTVTGNSVSALNASYGVDVVLSTAGGLITSFKSLDWFDAAALNGHGGFLGAAMMAGTTLTRASNVVTASTATPHALQVGYRFQLSQVPAIPTGGTISTIVIDNEDAPGVATITTSAPHGLVPSSAVTLLGINAVPVGGGIVNSAVANGLITITTAAAHNLSAGQIVNVSGTNAPAFGDGQWTIIDIPTPTSFSYETVVTAYYAPIGNAGTVTLQWPTSALTAAESIFTVQETPTATTFTVPISYPDGRWNSGTVTFAWDGSFYVSTVSSPTSFQYQQKGPDATSSVAGTVTPQGQIAPGVHSIVLLYLTDTGFIPAPCAPVQLTANGGQYLSVTGALIGPPNVKDRYLGITGANGSRYFVLPIPAMSNGQQISTSTTFGDNTSTSVVIDISDQTLLAGDAIDIPGNNLFAQVPLALPRGVEWYGDRLFWLGEKNVVGGFVNLGMDGGTALGSTIPTGWTATGAGAIRQVGIMPAYVVTGPDSGALSQGAATNANGSAIIQLGLNYSMCFWMLGSGSQIGQLTFTISSASTGYNSVATFDLADLVGSGYYTVSFGATMPMVIPSDLTLALAYVGLVGTATIRDLQPIYADNPNRNPIARSSYVENPEAYDSLTGNIGPNDDGTELRTLFVHQESLHFLTQKGLYSAEQAGSAEPSSWGPVRISLNCGAFDSNAVTIGKGWAAWAGTHGAFWYSGGLPQKTSAIITPTWKKFTGTTNVYNDSDVERVYFGMVDPQGNESMLVYDYHEIEIGGSGKWCPWNRSASWVGYSASGTTFVIGPSFYQLDTAAGIADDNLGPIGANYTFAPFGVSMFSKDYSYLGLRITGTGVLTPFLYKTTLTAAPQALSGQDLAALLGPVAEWDQNISHSRNLFLQVGQPGVQFELEAATVLFASDPNGPITGAR